MSEKYVYGFGRMKHIKDPEAKARNGYRVYCGEDVGLCGAYGGAYLTRAPKAARPVCQHCLRISARQAA